jgi:hypothetical protein
MRKPTNTTLIRMLRVGESLSFDQGRIKVELEEKSGRTARLRLTLWEKILVDKPMAEANDRVMPKESRTGS